ncbi:MAG: DNA repair protein RadC [Oscillospiraceae bacterium]|nr:DNA repair protein RadC [Oscillospiraceae bacterium]
MGIHDGHRQRLKERFIASGLDDFADHNVLELILFYSNPRSDTNVLAHELTNSFGDISAVMDAPIEALTKLPGISYHTAVLLKLFPMVGRRYLKCRTDRENVISRSEVAANFILPYFFGERDEVIYAMFLDGKSRVINCEFITRGSLKSAAVNVRKISERALINNAAGMILFHNHVTGLPLPSNADLLVTDRLNKVLRGVDVTLYDHIILSEDDYVSLKDSGYMHK